MIENRKSRTALLCVDLADGRLWLRNSEQILPDAQLITMAGAPYLDGTVDCILSTPAARGDKQYGFVIQNHLAPKLSVLGRKR